MAEQLGQDLGAHIDAVQAAQKLFWDALKPRALASRSTLAVVANRVDKAAQAREAALLRQLNTLKARLVASEGRILGQAEQIRQLQNPNVPDFDIVKHTDAILKELMRRWTS